MNATKTTFAALAIAVALAGVGVSDAPEIAASLPSGNVGTDVCYTGGWVLPATNGCANVRQCTAEINGHTGPCVAV